MIIIADSGSTKTKWSLLDKTKEVASCITGGINPFFMEEKDICILLEKEFNLDTENVSCIYFYGAGCALPEKKQILKEALKAHFKIHSIEIFSDLMAAARSLCLEKAGIACIIGTGSNSCYYDGKEIIRNVSPLGFILGDEGSGAVLGKQLISDILKNQLPEAIREDFFHTYNITPGEILDRVYKKPFPNRFLAQYTRFIAKNIHLEEMNQLVNKSFHSFFQRNVMQYEEAKIYPIHFTGSIAHIFRKNLETVIESFGLKMGTIASDPMEGLIAYHQHQMNS